MKIAKFAAVTAALAFGLSACGGAEPAEPPKAADSSAPTGPKYAGQTLTVWRLGDPNDVVKKYQDDLSAAFTAATGATVNTQWIPWPEVNNRFTAAAAGGEGPDVTEIGNDQVLTWQTEDALADLTAVVQATEDFKAIPANLWGLETVDGKVYAVPWGGGTRAILYRVDWFKELGIEIPKNWDELVAAGKKIVEKKGKDVDGFAFNGGSDSNHALAPFTWSLGGEYAVKEGDKWVGKLTDPTFKEGFTFYADLVAKHGVSRKSALTQNATDIRTRFANNKVGMYITAPWDIATIKEANKKLKDEQMGFFTIPAKDGSPAPAFQGGNDIAVWNDAKNKELAYEFVKLAAGKQWGTRYATDGGLLPLYPDALAALASDPVQAPFAATFPKARTFPNDANWTEANETKAVLQNALRAVIEGKKNVDTALADANTELETILNQ
ncbi:extracellular solute-binding protein [Rhizohabitans arisaemae]|uniref:extracellular solute-binding protein n=1 Tax=Rhizohabitans arisaemae TaxID=2720610 RepID=UPI0024B23182|nr:extracellular solute-binding protein [Rhizohabitans arisaemae]